MKSTVLITTFGLLAASLGAPLLAADQDGAAERTAAADTRPADGFDHGMRTVPNNAAPGQRGHGWRYFSDPEARRAVVISPEGDYYLSRRGKGLRWVAAEQSSS